jgi:hypothetical protein
VGRLEEWLHGVPSKHTTVVKLALRGTLGLAENARLEAVLEDSRLTFALLNTWELHSDLVVAPDDADLAALDVSGYVREALDDLALEAGRADEKGIVARDALNLLYRLAQ